MKIVWGSFGVGGSAFISRDGMLVVEGIKKAAYARRDVRSAVSRIEKAKKIGVFGLLVGLVVLLLALGALFGLPGMITAVVVAVAGSFYTETTRFVDIEFSDGAAVCLECTPRGLNKLLGWVDAA